MTRRRNSNAAVMEGGGREHANIGDVTDAERGIACVKKLERSEREGCCAPIKLGIVVFW